MKKFAVLNLVLVLSLLVGTAAFAQEDIQVAAYDYFSGGTKNITSDVVYDNLMDGDDTNNPYIVSVRSQEDYEKGHIPTAVWADAKTFFTADNLAKLPMDNQIVVYCYTGQTASQIVSSLRMMGYDAYNLLFGFGSWNPDPNAGSKIFDETTMGNDFPTTTDPTAVTLMVYPMPTPLGDTVQAAADAYFGGGTKNISAADLFDNLNDGDTSNDPFILSVRSAEDYAKGHITGAVQVDVSELFIEASLTNLPDDRQIVVYCYTGQTASQVTSALRLLGYDAYNMTFGMQAWTMDQDVRVKSFNAETQVFGYPYEGTAATAAEETTEETTTEETTTEETTTEPETMPETGGAGIPVEAVLVGFGALSAGAGLFLRRRKAA